MKHTIATLLLGATLITSESQGQVKLITLDPGHFHAALVQKSMNPDIDPVVHVYAPAGPELQAHLSLIRQYNERTDQPTHWDEQVYTGPDYLQRMLAEKKGNVVVMAGNNRMKTEYIEESVKAGLNVLGDKPMAINEAGFRQLVRAFDEAKARHVLLYDIMTERSEITNTLQRALSQQPAVFGALKAGSANDPSVIMESVHFYYKNVSGKVLTRPDWFFDPAQQGEALADVGTHLIDLTQWICYPETALDYKKDIRVLSARTWPTPLSLDQYAAITKKPAFPPFLNQYLKGNTLEAHGNGELMYQLKNVFVKLTARWEYQAPDGSGDTHHAILKGTRATLEIRQGREENYQPTLYIFAVEASPAYTAAVEETLKKLAEIYPGIGLTKLAPDDHRSTGARTEGGWRVEIPQSYKVGHEAHFAQVMQRYLQYLKDRSLPQWEVPDMIAKYYTATKALQIAVKQK